MIYYFLYVNYLKTPPKRGVLRVVSVEVVDDPRGFIHPRCAGVLWDRCNVGRLGRRIVSAYWVRVAGPVTVSTFPKQYPPAPPSTAVALNVSK